MSSRVVPRPEAGAHGAGHAALVAGLDLAADLAGLVLADVEEMEHQRVRAEAAVAHTDAVLRAEDRCHLAVPVAPHVEGDDAEPRRAGVPQRVQLDPRQRGKPLPRVGRELEFLGREPLHAVARERPAGRPHRHRADDVGGPRLLALRKRRPEDRVERHEIDRPATAQVRRVGRAASRQDRSARRRRTARTSCGRRPPGSRPRVPAGRSGSARRAGRRRGAGARRTGAPVRPLRGWAIPRRSRSTPRSWPPGDSSPLTHATPAPASRARRRDWSGRVGTSRPARLAATGACRRGVRSRMPAPGCRPAVPRRAGSWRLSCCGRRRWRPRVGRGRTRRTVSRAPSYAAVATCDLNPAPRWTLLYQGRKDVTASATSVKADVLAA